MTQTAGILHCGDLGAAFGLLLRRSGWRVVTTCQGRSPETRRRAEAAGIEVLSRLDDVVRQSHLVFSFVLPSAAVEVACCYAECSHLRPPTSLFVEGNSIGPETLIEIETILERHGVPVVGATIHGVSQQLQELGVLYLSGLHAERVKSVCGQILQVRVLGDQAGTAKRMKLLLAGLSKSLNVLFLETGILAQSTGMLDQFLEGCRHFYPGIMAAMDRMLPTYPQHAARRVGELESIGQMARSCRSPHDMIHAAKDLLQRFVGRVPRPVPVAAGEPSQTMSSQTMPSQTVPSQTVHPVKDVIRLFAATLQGGEP